jgi:SH3-like domain-containing protein
MKPSRLLAMLLVPCCLPGLAHAVEFKSVGAAPAILYDAPTERGRRIFVAPRGMPVEVVLGNGEWTKVRDAAGDLTWVETKSLVAQRTLVGSTPNAKVRSAPNDTSPVVFSIDKGVLLEVAEPITSGWIKVKHKDGQVGYVKASDVWGD